MSIKNIIEKSIFYGLAATVVFAVTANSAHDLWSASFVYLAVIFLSVLFLAGKLFQKNPSIKLPLALPAAFLFFSLLLSWVFSQDIENSRFDIYNAFITVLIFYMASNIETPKKAGRLLLLSSLPAIFFAVSILIGFDIKKLIINENILAGYALIWLPAAVLILKSKESPAYNRKYSYVLLPSLAVCLIYAGSFLGYLITFVFFIYIYRNELIQIIKRYRPISFFIIILIIFLSLTAGYLRIKEDPFTALRLDRLYWWATAIKMFIDRPLSGIGIGAYPNSFLFYKFGDYQNTLYTHNIFLKYLSETGLIGISALVYLAFRFSRDYLHTKQNFLNHAILISVICVISYGFFNINLIYFASNVVLAVFAGVFYSNIQHTKSTGLKKPVVIILIAVLAVISTYILSPLIADRLASRGGIELESGNIHKSAYFYAESARLNPLNADTHHSLSKIFFSQYESSMDNSYLDEALIHIKKALKLRSKDKKLIKELERYKKARSDGN